ncbi:hypothetical protein KIN20_018591 [Parelaphostrongylus tenuis]|uniref:Uncharacterized protein n=1 Tax=Parelaphostrongylus tenuis TaxID=148309 RepID=A0AAD5QPQ4_PARTN|nr:hypothetical protein KIN20_018591 [Parelaphostrongylus tenuis]
MELSAKGGRKCIICGIINTEDVRKSRRKPKPSFPTAREYSGPMTRSRTRRLEAESGMELWRQNNLLNGGGGFVANIFELIRAAESALSGLQQNPRPAIRAGRRGSHLISDFNLTVIKPKIPVVALEPDMTALVHFYTALSRFRLTPLRFEGSLESAFMQYEAGVKCVLDQVKSARSIVEKVRSSSHWTLHFLMDAQLYMLDIQYEIWEYLTRYVQLAVFNFYQCSLWETHNQLFDARMHSLLFEMNTAAALSSQVAMCSSYIRRFEEWNRKTNSFSSVYDSAHGLTLSLIRHFGTCPFTNADFDMERMFLGAQTTECDSLENLLSSSVAHGSSASGSSFLFPSFAVLALCRNQIYREVTSYCSKYADELIRNDHHHLSLISPLSRAYVLSRFHESRAKILMRGNIMNLSKLIKKLNSTFDDLKRIVDRTGQVEFDCPCGQVVFCFDNGTVGVNINSLITESTHVLDPELAEEGRRIMGDCVKNTVFDPLTLTELEKENNMAKHDRMKQSIEMVNDWVMTVTPTYHDEVYSELNDVDMDIVEPIETVYSSSPAHVTVIEDEDDESDDLNLVAPKQTKKKSVTWTQ